jgi:hypothetical protein
MSGSDRSIWPSRFGHLIGVGTLFTVLAFLALQIIGPLAPARFVTILPETLFYARPDNPSDMVREGEQRLAEGDFDAATRAATQALQTSLVDSQAVATPRNDRRKAG